MDSFGAVMPLLQVGRQRPRRALLCCVGGCARGSSSQARCAVADTLVRLLRRGAAAPGTPFPLLRSNPDCCSLTPRPFLYIQTPTSAGGPSQAAPFSPGSFQPSSISTYQAALAAAQAALAQQAQQQQAQQQALAAALAAQPGSLGGGGGGGWGGGQHQAFAQQVQQQAHHAQHAQQQAQQAVSLAGFALGEHGPAAAAPYGLAARALPAGMLQQQLARSGLQAGAATGGGGGGARWASMDGSSPGGTPPLARQRSAEDIPHPADFDPLWR
jgi:hypothetical protein